jgi:hypothetical protein
MESPLVIDLLDLALAAALGVPTGPELHDWDEAPDGYRSCTRCRRYADASDPVPAACCPAYGSDWNAVGPLIERFGIELSVKSGSPEIWTAAERFHGQQPSAGQPTAEDHRPLLAVRRLILENPERIARWGGDVGATVRLRASPLAAAPPARETEPNGIVAALKAAGIKVVP